MNQEVTGSHAWVRQEQALANEAPGNEWATVVLAVVLVVQGIWMFVLTWLVASARERGQGFHRRIEELEKKVSRWLPEDGDSLASEPRGGTIPSLGDIPE